jgi:branched-chain amino acid transport system substrate-binding protein
LIRRLSAIVLLVFVASCGQPSFSGESLKIGALYPLTGPESAGGKEEWRGVALAAEMVNAEGGWRGHRIELVVKDSPSPEAAVEVATSLVEKEKLPIVLGAHGSTIAMQAAAATLSRGAIYWETGAVASDLLGFHDPHFFRTGVDGRMLGAASARFTAEVLASRLNMPADGIRVAALYVDDVYGRSVAEGAVAEAEQRRLRVVGNVPYSAQRPDYGAMVDAVKQANADVLFVASYLQDGVTFRREALQRHLHVRAMIGTSSAFCMPAFGNMLGAQAVGLYASDKPGVDINRKALSPEAARLLDRVKHEFQSKYGIRPGAAALAGFVSGWVLFHQVLPRVERVTPDAVAAAARSLDLPEGSQITGAGVRFAPADSADAGQNRRPASIIWQWQKIRQIVPVYPPVYAVSEPAVLPIDQ